MAWPRYRIGLQVQQTASIDFELTVGKVSESNKEHLAPIAFYRILRRQQQVTGCGILTD